MKEEPYIALTHYRDGRVLAVIVDGEQYTPAEIKAALEARDEYQQLLARAVREIAALHRNWAHERDYARLAHFRASAWARAWKLAAKRARAEGEAAHQRTYITRLEHEWAKYVLDSFAAESLLESADRRLVSARHWARAWKQAARRARAALREAGDA